MKNPIFIGFDIGTGSCKANAYSTSGQLIANTQIFYNVHHSQSGYAEQDPDVLIESFCRCLKNLVDQLPEQPLAIGISSCMHSLVLLDKNAKPLTPLITWEDTRSRDIAEQLRKNPVGKKIYRLTGTPIHSMSPLCKIAWFRKNQKRIFSRTVKFVGIKEYLWYRMFGTFEIDYAVASATGLFNIQELKWEKSALDFCGIRQDQLPIPVPTLTVRKNISQSFSDRIGLNKETYVCIGASDGCMANAGTNISGKVASVTIGTSSAIRITATRPIVDTTSMIFNYLLDKKTFVCGGPSNNGGNVLRWIFKEFLSAENPTGKDFEKLETKTKAIAPGCDGLLCLPYFFGERAPVWDERATAVFFGLKETHTKYHLAKAAQEGIAYSLRMILENLERKSCKIQTLNASGGFIHSKSWVQILADITGKKVIINEHADASATGAALWAAQSLKIKTSIGKDSSSKIVIRPVKANEDRYNQQFAIFKKIYLLTKKQMHLLNP